MRIKSMFVLALLLSLSLGGFVTKTQAQCGATCAMICGNRCQFECFGCSLNGCIDVAVSCCTAAHQSTGDTGPCLSEGSS